ncbi:MAG: 16S rRNA (guanine(527)-N(7))-methyltransferase RsmG [Oscillospiraceae bacterium]|nr:16S rRNA (guanine(527)-N(7))-methyltransferase RsmG [Oscillospiraceae bacterium]
MTILPYNEITALFEKSGMNITEEQYALLDKYADLLVEYNKVMNLTGITDPMGISEKHFLDSLLVFKLADIPENASVIDVGTGAGFPGVPMKLYRPDLDVTLLDSLNKRINFLEAVSRDTLPMTCVHARAEEGGRKTELRERFDIAAARAVAALPVLAEYCLPYVKVGGSFIAMKGPSEDISLGKNAVKLLGGEISDIIDYSLPSGDKRVMVIIKKISPTPTKYPRNGGQISKKNL